MARHFLVVWFGERVREEGHFVSPGPGLSLMAHTWRASIWMFIPNESSPVLVEPQPPRGVLKEAT